MLRDVGERPFVQLGLVHLVPEVDAPFSFGRCVTSMPFIRGFRTSRLPRPFEFVGSCSPALDGARLDHLLRLRVLAPVLRRAAAPVGDGQTSTRLVRLGCQRCAQCLTTNAASRARLMDALKPAFPSWTAPLEACSILESEGSQARAARGAAASVRPDYCRSRGRGDVRLARSAGRASGKPQVHTFSRPALLGPRPRAGSGGPLQPVSPHPWSNRPVVTGLPHGSHGSSSRRGPLSRSALRAGAQPARFRRQARILPHPFIFLVLPSGPSSPSRPRKPGPASLRSRRS